MKKRKCLLIAVLLSMFFSLTVYGNENTIYCSPDGTSDGAGTKDSPLTVEAALDKTTAGTTIILKDGTYSYSTQITISEEKSGTKEAPIYLKAEHPGLVTFDFSSESYEGTNGNERGIQLDADFWHIYGIKVYGAADNGMYVTGSNNIVELCVFEGNRDSGLQISRKGSNTPREDWPMNNLILNCTSFNNMDVTGENADGFAAKLTCGEGNVFNGCIAYCNVDDGWDLYTKMETGPIGSVTLINCIAFRNGQTSDGKFTPEADGNGFKLGGESIYVNHRVVNCIAFENKNHGFTDNSNPGKIALINCTSFNNSLENGKKSNFDFARTINSNNYFENLISFTTNEINSDKYRGTALNTYFYGPDNYLTVTKKACVDTKTPSDKVYIGDISDVSATESDFESIIAPESSSYFHKEWRNEDGSINTKGFLKVKENSSIASFGGSSLGEGKSISLSDIKFTTEDMLKFPEKEKTTRGKLNIYADEEPDNSFSPLVIIIPVSLIVAAVAIIAIIMVVKKKKSIK